MTETATMVIVVATVRTVAEAVVSQVHRLVRGIRIASATITVRVDSTETVELAALTEMAVRADLTVAAIMVRAVRDVRDLAIDLDSVVRAAIVRASAVHVQMVADLLHVVVLHQPQCQLHRQAKNNLKVKNKFTDSAKIKKSFLTRKNFTRRSRQLRRA